MDAKVFNVIFYNSWNCTKECWYNFRSYICGTEQSHIIHSNYNSISDVDTTYDCSGYNKVIESDCCCIIDEVCDYPETDLQRSIVF